MNFLDFIFPKTCLSCGSWGKYICRRCYDGFIPLQRDSCLYCDRIAYLGQTHEHCRRPGEIDCYVALWYLSPSLKRAVRQIKYKLVTDAFRELCHATPSHRLRVVESLRSAYPSCLIQPIPLHPYRQQARGFNQADLIARFLHEGTGYPIINSLQRTKDTSPQAQTTSRMQRYLNMRDAFTVGDASHIAGQTIVLVDDIYTTGNTVKEAARTCKKAGADNVFVFTLAKG